MRWLAGDWQHLWAVAATAAVMFLVALVGLRTSERRTFAQWRIMDFVTAVAIGAVIGQTAVATSRSLLTGVTTLVTLLAVHRLTSWVRRLWPGQRAFDHPIRVLVHDGRLRGRELRRCGLDEDDVTSHLRQQGVRDLDEVKYLLYEPSGQLTVVGRADESSPLVESALDEAADFPPP